MQEQAFEELKRKLQGKKVMILGMDGYLGWALALRLASLGCRVSGLDNGVRRAYVAEKGGDSIVPIFSMAERIAAAKEVLGVDLRYEEMDVQERDKLRAFLLKEQPDVIVHYGEIPSAPYSMVDADHAIEVQRNNVLGTLGLLWLMKEVVPEATLLKLGTMGEYGSPLSGRPIFEGVFPEDAKLQWNGKEWSLAGEMTPRDAVSFYHISKVQDTYNVAKACKIWGLRSYDVMQGVIYGVHTKETAADLRLRTRFDIDEWFGTAVNRFVAQAILGTPLTLYGLGEQIRGFIALEDAMECMVRLISRPLERGKYETVNQVSGLYKINDIAERVAKIASQFGLAPKIQRLENPRVEAEQHPYEVVSRTLRRFGFEPQVSLEQEIARMFELLQYPACASRLRDFEGLVLPATQWSGEHRKSKQLETYEAGIKKAGGYEPRLDRST